MSVYKDKKTNNWVVTLRYKDNEGNTRRRAKRGFKTKREAVKWENDFLENVNRDPRVYKSLNEFYKIYLSDIKHKIRPTTYVHKKRLYRLYIKEFLGNKNLIEIETRDILDWQSYVLSLDFKPSYSRSINNQLTAIFNHAVRYYELKDNPMKKTDPIGAEKSGKMKYWTLEEFNQFLSSIHNDVFKLYFKVLFYTGMRIGELIAVRLKNVNTTKGYIEITHTARFENQEYIFSKPKTSASERIVTLPQFLNIEIKNYIEDYRFTDPEEQLFMTCRNKMGYTIRRYAEVAGVKQIRIHDLRHSHASLLINQGIQPNIVQQRLGHQKIETTLSTYSHLYPNKQYELASFIDDIVENSDKEIEVKNNPLMIETIQ